MSMKVATQAEEIANSFKPKFTAERSSRGRLAQAGTPQHTAGTQTEIKPGTGPTSP